MTVAYDKIYLEKARNTLGRMLDYAVNYLHYKIEDFYQLFLNTRTSVLFAKGDCTVIAGVSGIELAYLVLEENKIEFLAEKCDKILQPTKEYWTGFALAYFQWKTGLTFQEINKTVPISKIFELYYPYHEMDILQFVDKMNELVNVEFNN